MSCCKYQKAVCCDICFIDVALTCMRVRSSAAVSRTPGPTGRSIPQDKLCSRGVQIMDIKRSGSQPSGKGPAEYFTGTVRIDPLFQTSDPARALGVSVTFEPCARTAWHMHPLGQTLIVTAACGLVQSWGGPIEE